MRLVFVLSVLLAAATAIPGRVAAQPSSALLAAVPASLGDVMAELAKTYEQSAKVKVSTTAAGSNTLARQIVEGAPIDLFISADAVQMDVVEKASRLIDGSRVDLLTNQLALVAAAGSTSSSPQALVESGVRRVAMGQPESVPAGVYGRQWLERLGLWAKVQPKVVPLPSVRAALAAVEAGRAEAAIVYATDASVAPGLRVAYLVPAAEGPPIVYPAALVRGKREAEAKAFLQFLRSPAAAKVFMAAGFGLARP